MRIVNESEPESELTIFRMTQFFIYILLSPGHGDEEHEGESIWMARRVFYGQVSVKGAAVDVMVKPSNVTSLDEMVTVI